MSDVVLYEQQGAVAIIILNRPDRMNSFNTQLSVELLENLDRANEDKSVRVVVLAGAGSCFSAGADLIIGLEGKTLQEKLQSEFRPFLAAIAAMPKPVIAAVNETAAGISMSLALQCDLLIMADNAFLLSPFTTISLVPDGGLNWLLVRQLGYRRAFQLSIESDRIDAASCVKLGLANKTAPADQLLPAAIQWAEQLSERAPLSLAATKKAMRFAMDNHWDSSFDTEVDLQDVLIQSEDSVEGIAAYLEKRNPVFKGK